MVHRSVTKLVNEIGRPWSRGCGYPRDEKGLPKERTSSYERFLHYLNQGPQRTRAETAIAFGTSKQAIGTLALKFNWAGRAAEFDSLVFKHGVRIPKTLQEAASEPSPLTKPWTAAAKTVDEMAQAAQGAEASPDGQTLVPAMPQFGGREQEHLEALEEFRRESETLGRRQMAIARGMTQLASASVAEMLSNRALLRARELPSFISAACSMAAAAQHNWGRAIGVDRLLLTMEQAIADREQELVARAAQDIEVIG